MIKCMLICAPWSGRDRSVVIDTARECVKKSICDDFSIVDYGMYFRLGGVFCNNGNLFSPGLYVIDESKDELTYRKIGVHTMLLDPVHTPDLISSCFRFSQSVIDRVDGGAMMASIKTLLHRDDWKKSCIVMA